MTRAVLFALALALTGPAVAAEAPEAFVERVLRDAWSAFRANTSLIGPDTIGRYFEPGLARILLEDGDLGADPILNAQDASDVGEIRARVVGRDEGDRLRVRATWTNGGSPQQADYVVVETKAGWRIYDIEYLMITPEDYLFQLELK